MTRQRDSLDTELKAAENNLQILRSRLAAAPVKGPFIRWAGELHDRFFLPAFVWEDLTAICADLKAHSIPFDVEWLRPAWEFRFPKIGELKPKLPTLNPQRSTPVIEFRQALEAWPLLGESPNAGTVARTVDASLDRLEAYVADATALETGLLLVNGLPCEFRRISDSDSQLSSLNAQLPVSAATGIRYRAFYLTPSLQPHVPVHAPD